MFTQPDILSQSAKDFSEDLERLLYCSDDLHQKLTRAMSRLIKNEKHIHPGAFETTTNALRKLDRSIQTLQTDILRLKKKSYPTIESLLLLSGSVQSLFERLRTLTKITGSTITSLDWQSPSYDASGFGQAGRLTGRIHATSNDYKRDQHEDAFRYEQKFLEEYIDAPLKYPVHSLATHTGMAAFTTILGFLLGEGHIKHAILMGSSAYWECKQVVKSLCGKMYHEIDETDIESVKRAIIRYQPDAIFLDTIANDPIMAAPDIFRIISLIEKHSKNTVYLVIDNTCTSIYCQLIARVMRPFTKIRVIGFESLNKFHQFGMDQSFGGIVYSWGGDTINMFNWRVHLGTNISDAQAVSLPTPNRMMLTRYMERLERNTKMVASALQNQIATSPNTPLSHIVYPALSIHPDNKKSQVFHGAFFTLCLKKKYQSIPTYKRLTERIMKQAKKDNTPLVAGTSFGLPTTRVYLTAIRATETTPFIRIACGCEALINVEKVIRTLSKALSLTS